MSVRVPNVRREPQAMTAPTNTPSLTPAQAKAELLAWAEITDVETAKSGSSFTAMAVKGGLVVLGGLLLTKLLAGSRRRGPEPLGTGKRLISMALIARAAAWVLPHALRWIQAAKSPSSNPSTKNGGAETGSSGSAPAAATPPTTPPVQTSVPQATVHSSPDATGR